MSQTELENGNGMEGATITTRAPKAEKSEKKPENWSITLPDPTAGLTLEEMANKFGEEKVNELAKANFIIRFQSAIRSMAEAGKSDEEIAATMQSWKPGDKVLDGTKDPEQSILKNFGNMTPEQRAELMAKLSAMSAN